MPILHEVKPGDCISSIAFQYGFFGDTIWLHSSNTALREARKNPNTLFAGEDVVFVPDKQLRMEPASTGLRHRYRRRGVPETLRIRLLDENDLPRVAVPYKLTIGRIVRTGKTNAQGVLVEPIPPNAHQATLLLGEGDDAREVLLQLGYLHPLDTLTGVRERLEHLGYLRLDSVTDDADLEEETTAALLEFQKHHGLPGTGKLDGPTLAKLKEHYLS